MIALIDGDVLVYQCGFSSEKKLWTVNFNNKNYSNTTVTIFDKVHRTRTDLNKELKERNYLEEYLMWVESYEVEPIENCLHKVKLKIQDILTNTGATSYKIFLSTPHDDTLFRLKYQNKIAYKANRKDLKKPEHYDNIREYLLKNYNTEQVCGIEADDALGIYQTDETIICSIDKDLRQIPGKHYNMNKNILDNVSVTGGWNNMYTQVLTGDRADNIPGLNRIGDKTAKLILDKLDTPVKMYEVCLEEYQRQGKSQEDMEEVCNMVYILRRYNDRWSRPND